VKVARRRNRIRKNRPRNRSQNGKLQMVSGEGLNVCEVCAAALGKPGGYAGTGMCGPCCTGESATLDEFGSTW